MNWTLIWRWTRSTFWSICLAAFGREARTEPPSYLKSVRIGRLIAAWQLVTPDPLMHEKTRGEGAILTLGRLGLLEEAHDEARMIRSVSEHLTTFEGAQAIGRMFWWRGYRKIGELDGCGDETSWDNSERTETVRED